MSFMLHKNAYFLMINLFCVIRSIYCWMMAFNSRSICGCSATLPIMLVFISESVSA